MVNVTVAQLPGHKVSQPGHGCPPSLGAATEAAASFGPKRCLFGKLVANPICVPNLKSLASTVAKIRRGSQFFGCSSSPDPASFGPKRCLFGKLVANPICVPSLKLLS